MAKPYPTNIIAEKILNSKLIGKYIGNYGHLDGLHSKRNKHKNVTRKLVTPFHYSHISIFMHYDRHQEITMYGYIRDYELSLVLLTTAPSYLITTTYI